MAVMPGEGETLWHFQLQRAPFQLLLMGSHSAPPPIPRTPWTQQPWPRTSVQRFELPALFHY